MAKLNIIYFSTSGNTEQMSIYIEQGAKEAGVEAEMISVDAADESSVNAEFIAFGSPASGSEEVAPEITEFIESVKDKLKGRKIGIFGSYDWGGGEWLSLWADELSKAGISVVGKGCMANLAPDDTEKIENCKEYGKQIVNQ